MAIDVQNAHMDEDEAGLNVSINTTPLVDVMLVMLIIFLVTIPVIVKTIPLQLPTYRNIVTVTKPENIVVFVTNDEQIYNRANGSPIDQATLKADLTRSVKTALASHRPFPEVHIRADKNVRFEAVGRVILACQQVGIQKVGFITEPHNLEAGSQ